MRFILALIVACVLFVALSSYREGLPTEVPNSKNIALQEQYTNGGFDDIAARGALFVWTKTQTWEINDLVVIKTATASDGTKFVGASDGKWYRLDS